MPNTPTNSTTPGAGGYRYLGFSALSLWDADVASATLTSGVVSHHDPPSNNTTAIG